MAESYEIRFAEGAECDFHSMTTYARRLILGGLERHLAHQPTEQSRRIERMRPNPIAAWEPQVGDYRVLYDVDESEHAVTVQVIGEKVGNRPIVQERSIRPMKVIDLNEAKANLELYAQDCQQSPVIVTIGGVPRFEMVPIRDVDPDFIDRLLETNEAFRRLAEESKRQADEGRVSTLAEVRRRLLGPE